MHPPGWDPMFAKLTPPWAACAVSRRFLSHSWQLPQVPLSHTLEDALIQQLVPQQAMAMGWGVQWLQCFHPIPCFDLLLYTFIGTVTLCPCGTISGTWERQSLPSGSVEVGPRNIPSRWHTLCKYIGLFNIFAGEPYFSAPAVWTKTPQCPTYIEFLRFLHLAGARPCWDVVCQIRTNLAILG